MDCSLSGSSIHGDSPVKNIRVGCHASSRESSQPRNWTQASHIACGFITIWAIREETEQKLYFYPTINIFHLCNLWTMVKMQISLIKYLSVHAHHFTVSASSLSLNFPPLYSETLVKFSSVAQSCPTLCDPMNRSMPDLLVHRQLPEFTQTHVHWVSDAIPPSHPLLSPSPPAFNLSQLPGLFRWVSSSHQVAKVLEFQLQHQSFQWIFRTDLLQNGLVGSPCSPSDSQESSPIPQFKGINS